jgi:hypothetical protein
LKESNPAHEHWRRKVRRKEKEEECEDSVQKRCEQKLCGASERIHQKPLEEPLLKIELGGFKC